MPGRAPVSGSVRPLELRFPGEGQVKKQSGATGSAGFSPACSPLFVQWPGRRRRSGKREAGSGEREARWGDALEPLASRRMASWESKDLPLNTQLSALNSFIAERFPARVACIPGWAAGMDGWPLAPASGKCADGRRAEGDQRGQRFHRSWRMSCRVAGFGGKSGTPR